jgi:hypothetical protein
VRVAQSGGGHRLAPEALHELRVAGQLGAEQLDRYGQVELGIVRPVDASEAAGPMRR